MQRVAELQGLLEGIALPATKDELIAYARGQDVSAARDLSSLPDREYRSIDDVGEALAPVQPQSPLSLPTPHEESGHPPGGDSYTDPNPDTGAVDDDAPPYNPPQKAIEEQSKTLKKQQERQKEAELG
jgi:Protein of unknown function (DUF2795)